MATKKRVSDKEKKINQEKEALRQRLTDLVYGANSGCEVFDWENVNDSMDLKSFFGYIDAVRKAFDLSRKDFPQYVFQIFNLHVFASLNDTVETLYDEGVRA